jgi:hypothetical protein
MRSTAENSPIEYALWLTELPTVNDFIRNSGSSLGLFRSGPRKNVLGSALGCTRLMGSRSVAQPAARLADPTSKKRPERANHVRMVPYPFDGRCPPLQTQCSACSRTVDRTATALPESISAHANLGPTWAMSTN